MLGREQNERLTRVGPGTPCGELLRRYWQPLCAVVELTPEQPKRRVQIMGENVVVYRGEDGTFGCVVEHCAHRGCSLYYGFVEGSAIRCAYHGWKFERDGHVTEQPFEPPGSSFKDKVRQKAYPVEELNGLLFVYMGPAPAPLVPRWDVMVREDGTRRIQVRPTLNCNWLQAQENTADTTHTYYLHGHMMRTRGLATSSSDYYYRPITSYEFSYCDWGIDKRMTYGGDLPEDATWPPQIFPNILRIPEGTTENLHWRVPIDDTHTRTIMMSFRPAAPGEPPLQQTVVPIEYMPDDLDENGEYKLTTFWSQDRMAWETQGALYDRTEEHLGTSDQGIIMFRKLLDEQIAIVERGGEPMALVRDPERNRIIEFTYHSVNRLEAVPSFSGRA